MEAFQCERCLRNFRYKQGLERHKNIKKRCPSVKEVLTKEAVSMQEKIEDLLNRVKILEFKLIPDIEDYEEIIEEEAK